MRIKVVITAVLCAVFAITAKPPPAAGLAAALNDPYYGKVEGARKPAEVTSKTVFNEIPEYKQIKEKGLTESDAEYFILLNKANAKFYTAVKKVAEEDGHDVVVEKGSTRFESTPVDLTQKTINALEK
jgi:hypothetical protein